MGDETVTVGLLFYSLLNSYRNIENLIEKEILYKRTLNIERQWKLDVFIYFQGRRHYIIINDPTDGRRTLYDQTTWKRRTQAYASWSRDTYIHIDIAGLYPVRPIRLLSRSTYLGTGQLKTFATFYLARGPVLKTESQFGLIRLFNNWTKPSQILTAVHSVIRG